MVTVGYTARTHGFTIVELIIVIVVIAILAALVAVGYNGITKNAKEVSLLKEVTDSHTKIEGYRFHNQSRIYPSTAEEADVRMNEDTTFFYTTNANATGFCLSATNESGTYYRVTSDKAAPEEGRCALTVSTYAGLGTAGQVNGSLTAARFNNPTDAVMMPNGDMYVADYGSNAIRLITAAGTVSTFAGSTSSASGAVDSTTGTSARFYAPGGIDADSAGNLYVADQFNNRIRKITPGGAVSTLAGGSWGSQNGTGSGAQFYYPWDVAVSGAGTVYVADTYNNLIRAITPAGVVTTLAGSTSSGYQNGIGTAARFNYPSTIDIGPDGMLYVTDQDNNRIRKINPSTQEVTTLAGSGTKGTVDGLGTEAQFASPHGISVDPNGNVFVTDEYNHAIRKISPDGSVFTFAGGTQGFLNGTTDVARFNQPIGLAVSNDGVLYVVERGNHRIRTIQY